MYTKIRHAGYYLENKFKKNNVQKYLLLHKARQIHRLECNLGASQILNSNIPKKLGHFLPKVLRAGHLCVGSYSIIVSHINLCDTALYIGP